MQYLYEEQHYFDLYDLFTIKECLRTIDYWQHTYDKAKEKKEMDKKDLYKVGNLGLNLSLHYKKVERYEYKQQRIKEWMEKDRQRQEKYDGTPVPRVSCSLCGKPMLSESQHLEDYFDDRPMRMLFLLGCEFCHRKKAVYEEGSEKQRAEYTCPKCNAKASFSLVIKGNISTWTTKCSSCNFFEEEVEDSIEWENKRQKEEHEDKLLLEKYRANFCLSDEEGKKQVADAHQQMTAMKHLEEMEQKHANPMYKKAMKIKKLNITEVEKLLTEAFEKAKYVKLTLAAPEMGKYVTVPFTAQDIDTKRVEYDSRMQLQKIIKKMLEGSNWELMSDGVQYRVGYVSGRLKAFETEADLMDLVKSI